MRDDGLGSLREHFGTSGDVDGSIGFGKILVDDGFLDCALEREKSGGYQNGIGLSDQFGLVHLDGELYISYVLRSCDGDELIGGFG